MTYRTTWILLVVALFGAGYYFLFEQPKHRRAVQQQIAEARLVTVNDSDVVSLRIERSDTTIFFVREKEVWRMTDPVADIAEQSNVNVLLHTLLNAVIERFFQASEAEVAGMGLSRPFAVITLGTSGPDGDIRLHLGDFNMTKASCYVRRQGEDAVLLVAAGVRRSAMRTVFDYRDKRVIDFPVGSVMRYELKAENELEWTRTGVDSWVTVQRGDTIQGDPTEVVATLRELRALRATRLVDEEIDEAFYDAAGRVDIWTDGDNGHYSLVFGEASTEGCYVAASNNPRVALVSADFLDTFKRTVNDFRDRRALKFAYSQLARITLQTSERTTSIVRKASEWSFTNPALGAIDQQAVEEFILSLQQLKFREIAAERVDDPGAYGLEPPFYRLTLYNDTSEVLDEIVTGATEPLRRIRFTTSRSSGHLGVIDAEPMEELQRQFDAFRVQ